MSSPGRASRGVIGAAAALAVLASAFLLSTGVAFVRPQLPSSSRTTAPGARAQLAFLDGALANGAGEQMQQLFPEGFFFTAVLDGLAWVQVGLAADEAGDEQGRTEALAGARSALALLDGPSARAPFSAALTPRYGVFYVGWSSWLRGGVLALSGSAARDPAEVARLEADCDALAGAFRASGTPFLQAYPGQAWPVDSVVAAAALRLHDRVLAPRYDVVLDAWLEAATDRVDPGTALLPHRADPLDGRPLEGARGSSQSIIARFLPEVDPDLGAEHYARFRRAFVAAPFGLPGVREYPRGSAGPGDVDSGPLVGGLSASASVVALAAAQVHDDRALAEPLAAAAELVGLPVTLPTGKRYAGGVLPVGDAFLVWARTARPLVTAPPACACAAVMPGWWRLPWLALLGVVGVVVWLPALTWWRRRSR